jgi:predicted nucleotidyltransferase component of viral defense system
VRTLVPMLAEQLNIPDQPLIEKDVRLHLLLGRLTRDRRFGPHVAFKGGTCLIKCYWDYPRFRTDLDFTWVDPRTQTPGLPWGRRPSAAERNPRSASSRLGT